MNASKQPVSAARLRRDHHLRRLLLCFVFGCEEDALEWLERMIAARRQLDKETP